MKWLWASLAICAMTILFCIGVAFADEPQLQARDLGNKAAMHVYWYAPQSMEITHVETYLFKDEGTCTDAIPKAMAIVLPTVSHGDHVNIQCVGLMPPGPKVAT